MERREERTVGRVLDGGSMLRARHHQLLGAYAMVTLFLFHNSKAVILVGSMDAVIKQLRMLCLDGPVIDVFSRKGRVQ